jgi:hypothetical protein
MDGSENMFQLAFKFVVLNEVTATALYTAMFTTFTKVNDECNIFPPNEIEVSGTF